MNHSKEDRRFHLLTKLFILLLCLMMGFPLLMTVSVSLQTMNEVYSPDLNLIPETLQFGNFVLQAVCAKHSVPAIGLIVRHEGVTMYFSGDTEYDEKLEELIREHIDIMFICINGRLGNMSVSEAVKLTKIIKPKVGIPTHYGMFESNTENPEKYTSQLSCGFELKYNQEYQVSEVLSHV